eukprot:CAMPEP_0113893830 /NCGR_PEP_ID=MMETSP0780_2-20120614/16330_1 /TAXON_ID=652834 /ORGANISM="Palpitomonas bilix" /LENGTH=190 /DNA_ID=CAMNT_0000884203 /DNA_START=178 /DNA_END=750 /DNA_ORIENTATION=+ /assembly_acc=CAM_ASM_000599
MSAFVKMLLLATFAPEGGETDASLWQAVVTSMCNLVDIAVLVLLALNYRSSSRESLAFGVALGWAFIESFTTNIAPLWVGARGSEFDWKYIGMGVKSNMRLIGIIGMVLCASLSTKKSSKSTSSVPMLKEMCYAAMVVFCFYPLIHNIASSALALNLWTDIGLEAAVCAGIFAFSHTLKKLSTPSGKAKN